MAMNITYFKLSDSLKNEFYTVFRNSNEDEIFLFFRKILQYIENDDSPYNNLIIFSNPKKDLENIEFMKAFNRTCRTFLETSAHSKNVANKKASVGKATCFIGMAYEYQLFNYPLDYEKSCEYYELATQLNDPLATYKLAQCNEKGRGTTKDVKKALYFYRCAAKLGITDALHTYGSIIMNGFLDAPKDERLGMHYLSLAAIQADLIYPYPLFDIGKKYEKKGDTLDIIADETYAYSIYLKGAILNDPNCQNKIARCYENGELKKHKNLKKAIAWYKKAAEGGQIDSQLKLFAFLSSGIPGIIKKDLKSSYFWALRAGTKGFSRSMFYLGELSLSGSGTEQNIILAYWWYKIAACNGSREGQIKMQLTADEINKRDLGPTLKKTFWDVFCCRTSKFRKNTL